MADVSVERSCGHTGWRPRQRADVDNGDKDQRRAADRAQSVGGQWVGIHRIVLRGRESALDAAGLGKKVLGGGMEQAVVADGVQAGGRDVLDEALKKLVVGEAEEGFAAFAVGFDLTALVTDSECIALIADDACRGDGAAADIAGQVGQHALAVRVARLDAHRPLLAAQFVEQVDTLLWADIGRRLELVLLNGFDQHGPEFASELGAQNTAGQQDVAFGFQPLAVGADAAGGNQEVGMDMGLQGLRPGVQGTDRAGQSPQVVGIGQQLAKRVPGGLEQQG